MIRTVYKTWKITSRGDSWASLKALKEQSMCILPAWCRKRALVAQPSPPLSKPCASGKENLETKFKKIIWHLVTGQSAPRKRISRTLALKPFHLRASSVLLYASAFGCDLFSVILIVIFHVSQPFFAQIENDPDGMRTPVPSSDKIVVHLLHITRRSLGLPLEESRARRWDEHLRPIHRREG